MQQTQKKILRSTVYQLVVLIFLHYSFDEHFHMELLKIISYSSSMFQFLKRFFNQIENKIFFFVRDSNPEILPKPLYHLVSSQTSLDYGVFVYCN